MQIFGGQKLRTCFCEYSRHSNELIGYLDLSDFSEFQANCSSHINALKRVRFYEIRNSFRVVS